MSDRRPQRPVRSPQVRPARLPKARNAPDRRRRISRAEREAKRQRQLYIGIGAVVGLIAVILLGTFVWTDVVRPRQVLASVNGTDITRQDYREARGVTLVDQVDQYSYLAGVVGGDQATQYQNAAANAQAELDGVNDTTDVNQQFLQRMIDDQIYVQYADSLGITVTDQDLDTFILNRFAPQDAPLLTPTVEPTLVPERAAWATQTAVITGGGETPTPDATGGTPVANVDAATPITTDGTPIAGVATPIAESGTPAGVPESAVGTPAVSPTPDAQQALSTAEAGYDQYQDRAFGPADIDTDAYREWVAMPALARERVGARLTEQLGQSGPQVHGTHILVTTQELADQISQQLTAGAGFEEIARSQSTDTVTAPNGGDLGWYSSYDVSAEIWAQTASLPIGQTTAPFQTPLGWEIVRVLDSSPDRAFTDDQLDNARTTVVDQWVAARAAEADISGAPDPTPTTVPTTFEPPVNAPTGVAAPEGTPVAATPDIGAPVSEATPVTPLTASPAA